MQRVISWLLPFSFLFIQITNAQQLATKLKEVNSLGIPEETSGLCIINNTLFSINDSGNPSEIWSTILDSVYAENAVWRPIKINAKNIDWEAIETDEQKSHIYIGDFGNNKGKRQDLKVIKIPINGFKAKLSMDRLIIYFKTKILKMARDSLFIPFNQLNLPP